MTDFYGDEAKRKFTPVDTKPSVAQAAMIGNPAIGWGDADDRESVKAIHAALDAGINF